jgi:hypothetical protein
MNHHQWVFARFHRMLKADITLMDRKNFAGIAAQVAQVQLTRRRDMIETKVETSLRRKLESQCPFRPSSGLAPSQATPTATPDHASPGPNHVLQQTPLLGHAHGRVHDHVFLAADHLQPAKLDENIACGHTEALSGALGG